MLGVSNGALAAAVSAAGGLGMVPGGFDFSEGSEQLATLAKELQAARDRLGLAERTLTPVPVGVGFVLCHPSAANGGFEKNVLPLLHEHSPQAVWLFAPPPPADDKTKKDDSDEKAAQPDEDVQREVIAVLRHSGFKVFVQVGSVAAARRAAADGADAIVAQGVDAGGHQWARGAGVISLVPEIRTMLNNDFYGRDIVLVAAGGIVDGRGVAAALSLGTPYTFVPRNTSPS
jgi:nitronate monooxygenase